ncbi:MAG: response regulator [Pseudomonadota bacterium]
MNNVAKMFEHMDPPHHEGAPAEASLASHSDLSPPPITCVVMDDNDFDRRAIRRLADKSRHNIRLIETGSIAETRNHLAHRRADILLADYRVPDGDGIRFAGDVIRQGNEAPQVIVVTGENDTASAIEAIRAGASDYLPKEEMTLELFDDAIENAMRARGRVPQAQELPHDEVIAELTALRALSIQNSQKVKASILPLIAIGWQVSQGKIFAGPEREALQQKIESAAQGIPSLLDQLVISARCGTPATELETVDPIAILHDIADDETGAARLAKAKLTFGNLPPLKSCPRRMRLLFESLIQASIQFCPLGKQAEISIGAARDPSGRPIIWLRDNGVSLDVRKHSFGNNLAKGSLGADHADPFAWSLCQRIAQSLGAELKIKAGPENRTTVMLRFNKEHVD